MGPGTVLLERYRVTRLRQRASGLTVAEAVDRVAGGHARLVVVDTSASSAEDPHALVQRAARYAIGATALVRPELARVEEGRLVVAFAAEGERTLADELGTASPERVAELAVAIADALAVLHDQGIAHGALLPELVEARPSGVLVGGFGVAAVLQALGGPGLAAQAVPAAYRAPELEGAMPARAETWTDAYALAAMCSELLGGPLEGAEVEQPTPRALGASVADAVDEHVARALSATPSARPADLGVWARRLAKLLAGAFTAEPAAPGGAAPSSPGESPAAARAPEPAAAPPGQLGPGPAAEPAAADKAPGAGPLSAVPESSTERPPVSRSERRSSLLAVLGLVVGMMLMLGGIGAVLAFALSRSSSSSAPPAGAAGSYSAPPLGAGGAFGVGGMPGMGGAAPLPPVVPHPPAVPGVPHPPPAAPSASAGPAPAAIDAQSAEHPPAEHASAPIPVVEGVPVWGPQSAPVTLVVFGDLQDPHTRRAVDVLRQLKTTFGDDLRLAWQQRPIDANPRARDAAELAASLDSAAFWKLAGRAAGKPDASDPTDIERWVGELSQTPAGRAAKRVDDALTIAGLFDVRETPTFFVNGIRIEGNPGYAELDRVVRQERSAARALLASGTPPAEVYPERVKKNLIGLGDDVVARTCPDVRGAPGRGAPDPLVTVVEFSEFQCPFCKRVQPTLEALIAAYPGDVRVVFKNFPLEHHPRARPAANLALEALKQSGNGTFWQVHDQLFAAQPDLADAQLGRIARLAGLDVSAAGAAVASGKHDATIDTDVAQGRRLGVRGTPSFFINGRRLDGAQPLAEFRSVVDEELAAARRMVAAGVARKDVYGAICGR